ncbi:MAG TPA: zf-HC2 domain-containing protein [Thermoanaerobaculia bacterium]
MTRTSCRRVEPLLALGAGGDLSPDSAAAAAVEEHLSTCGACRRTAEALAATVHTIRELPASSFSSEETAALRRSVWERIEKIRAAEPASAARSRGVAWKAAGWAAAGLVALLLLLPWRPARDAATAGRAAAPAGGIAARGRDEAPPSSIATATEPPAPESAPPRIGRRTAPRRLRPIPESSEPVRIELSTPDPNVRIVWLVGSAGEDLPPLNDDFSNATTKEDPE